MEKVTTSSQTEVSFLTEFNGKKCLLKVGIPDITKAITLIFLFSGIVWTVDLKWLHVLHYQFSLF